MTPKPKRKEKPGAVLAIALGAPKKKAPMDTESDSMGARPMRAGGMGMDDSMASEMMSEELPEGSEDFEDYAATAFPELQADPVKLDAFRKAVMAAMKHGTGGGMGMRGR